MLLPPDYSDCATLPRSGENVCQTLNGSREAFFRPIFTKFGTKVHYHLDIIIGTSATRAVSRTKVLNGSREAIFLADLDRIWYMCVLSYGDHNTHKALMEWNFYMA